MSSSSLQLRGITNQHPVVDAAITFAQDHLSSVMRSDGDTYFEHGIEVAHTLEEVSPDGTLFAVAVLHDILVHPNGAALLKMAPISKEDCDLIQRMHGLRHLHIDSQTKDLDHVIDEFSSDPRLLLLRMAHRMNDVRHLNRFTAKRRREIARETLYMYTAISGRLGFQRWRWQMEDICFTELQPKLSQQMRQRFDNVKEIDTACLSHVRTYLTNALKQQGIDATIDERIKGLYSTYRKMTLKKKTFEELTDRLALRILVEKPEDCYRTLGIIHSCMHPIHGKLKDYIGTPKENGYRSIHTVVYPLPGISEMPIEIQIRTHQMHRECEFGIASHEEYKTWVYALSSAASRANLFRNLESLHNVVTSHHSFTKALQRSFNEDTILVFDQNNTVHHLGKQATANDFALQAKESITEDIKGVRINGRWQSLHTPLRDGDTVEIVRG